MATIPYTALVVDRNPGTRKTLASVLRQAAGITDIYQSASAKEALGLLKNANKVDWIFSDTSLPDQDCFKFIEEAKTTPGGKDSAIIVLSSQTNREILLKAAAVGVTDFIKKPFTSSTVVLKLRKLIDGKIQRTSSRVQVLEAFEALLNMNGSEAKSSLVDFSIGGCMVNAAPFGKNANIYDIVQLTVDTENIKFQVDAELIRIEHYQPEGEKLIQAGFRFVNVNDETRSAISSFIGAINKGG